MGLLSYAHFLLLPFLKMYRPLIRSTVGRQLTAGATRSAAVRSYASAHATPQPFNWEDPLNAASLFTAEEYCQERMLPRVLQAYRDENYDKKILEEMGELGLLGATIKGYDCAGVSNVASGLITKAVERV